MEELKPCPFCGSEAKICHAKAPEREWYTVYCPTGKCGVNVETLAYDIQEEAIKTWNKRSN